MSDFPLIIVIYFGLLGFILMAKLRKDKRKRFFNVDKLRKYQKIKRHSIVICFIFILAIIISLLYDPLFNLSIFASIGLILTFLSFLISIGEIYSQNKSKWIMINLIRDNYTTDLFELAKRIELPYSVLKQIINYLESTNERFF